MANAIHGRFGAFYVDQTAGGVGAASPLGNQQDWSINQARDRVETTSLGDGTKNYVAGLADASGTINTLLDSLSNAVYAVADGVARKFYLYIDNTDAASRAPVVGSGKGYWYGTATFDSSSQGGVSDVVKVTVNWSAATSVSKV